jgi:large subunit ribosomal protein L29
VKPAEIRELPSEEIARELAEKKRALFNLRFQRETEQLERPAELRKLKRDVARLLTVLHERELAEGSGAQPGAARPSPSAAAPGDAERPAEER